MREVSRVKRIQFQHLPCLAKTLQIMRKATFKKQLLLQNVQMDGSINFQMNGDINVYPCPWEDGKDVTDGSRVRYEAGVEVDANGRTRVKRWNRGSRGPMYKTLYKTAHGAVMCTRGRTKGTRRPSEEKIVVKLVFPRRYGLPLTKAMYQEETDEIMSYFKTRKEETIWK